MVVYNPNPQVNSVVGPGHDLHAVYAQEWDHVEGKFSNPDVEINNGSNLTGKIRCFNS